MCGVAEGEWDSQVAHGSFICPASTPLMSLPGDLASALWVSEHRRKVPSRGERLQANALHVGGGLIGALATLYASKKQTAKQSAKRSAAGKIDAPSAKTAKVQRNDPTEEVVLVQWPPGGEPGRDPTAPIAREPEPMPLPPSTYEHRIAELPRRPTPRLDAAIAKRARHHAGFLERQRQARMNQFDLVGKDEQLLLASRLGGFR